MHRFVWDMHYPPPAVLRFGYPISAVPYNTPRVPQGVWAMPGRYLVRLIVDGQRFEQPLTVRMDPRVKTTPAGLAQQFALSMRVDSLLRENRGAVLQTRVAAPESELLQTLTRLNGQLESLYNDLQDADAAPTTQMVEAVEEKAQAVRAALAEWRKARGQ
jgi:hypothetical protein